MRMGSFERAVALLAEQEDEEVKARVWVLRSLDTPYRYLRKAGTSKQPRFAVTYNKLYAEMFSSRIQALKYAQSVRALGAFEPTEIVV